MESCKQCHGKAGRDAHTRCVEHAQRTQHGSAALGIDGPVEVQRSNASANHSCFQHRKAHLANYQGHCVRLLLKDNLQSKVKSELKRQAVTNCLSGDLP